jgi:ribulose-phosphate 3-epimerase
LIEVDGGVNDETAPLLWKAGCDILVAGSYIFAAGDYAAAIDSISTLRP